MKTKFMITKISLALYLSGSFGTSFAADQRVSFNNCTFNIDVSTVESASDSNKRKRDEEQTENLTPLKRARLERFAPESHPISEEIKEKARIFLESIAVEHNMRNFDTISSISSSQSEGAVLNDRGLAYEQGRGVPLNPEMAFECYKMSAAKNYSYGQLNLGLCYYDGIGTAIDDDRARYQMLQAVKQDNPYAVFLVGEWYEKGTLLPQNDSKAFNFYRLATSLGIPEAQYNLGRYYEYGIGVERDLWQAICHYQEAAHQNDINALFRVGNFYQFGIDEDGLYLRKNLETAKFYYKKGRIEEERRENATPF